MYTQSHGMERCIDLDGTSYVRNVWARDGGGRYLFCHGGEWRISATLDPVVKIGGGAVSFYGIVNGYPAWTGKALCLFRSQLYGWVVADDFEEPREFDYAVQDLDADGNLVTDDIQGGSEFYVVGNSIPGIGSSATAEPRGSLRGDDSAAGVTVSVEWDYWRAVEQGTEHLPALGRYVAVGTASGQSPIMIGYPNWTLKSGPDGVEAVEFRRESGTLYRVAADGSLVEVPDGDIVIHSDESGAWKTSARPVADTDWSVPYVYGDEWDGERPAVDPIVLTAGRCIEFHTGLKEYVFPTARIP